ASPAAGPLPPQHESRRAAGALERPPRRHESSGPTPAADGVPPSLLPRAGPPPRGAPGDHGVGTGERTECFELGREVRPGRLVRGQLQLLARSQDPPQDPRASDQAPRDQPRGGGNDDEVHRISKGYGMKPIAIYGAGGF